MKVVMQIQLDLKAPFLSQSSEPGHPGIDSVIARNSEEEVIIPNSLISGKLKQALEELDSVAGKSSKWFAPDIAQWFGIPPDAKQLVFSDFRLIDDEAPSRLRHRIKIDQDCGAVSRHQLFMAEQCFISGQTYKFVGKVSFFCPDQIEADHIEKHLSVALQWLSQLGALRTVGFGKLAGQKILHTTPLAISNLSNPSGLTGTTLAFSLSPEQAFCLPGKPVADNLFESEAIIPGGAIKASIATTWSHIIGTHNGKIDSACDPNFCLLKEHFAKIRISHAFPSKNDERPVVAPLSLARIERDEAYYDVASLSKPALINKKAPDFALDWKDDEKTLKDYPWPYLRMREWGWPSLKSELRVRTAIDRVSLRSAENELFAYTQILPENSLSWIGDIDLSLIEEKERPEVVIQLQTLLQHGVIGLGKTKAPAQMEFCSKHTPKLKGSINPDTNGQWVIVLQTDCLIGSPGQLKLTSGHNDLKIMYRDFWHDLSEGKLYLQQYFARQKLAGGAHRKIRFKQSQYKPWLLTEAASVFVLGARNEASTSDIIEQLKSWLASGLPLTVSCMQWYGIDPNKPIWEQTPYLPENGYGEITVNLDYNNKATVLTDTSEEVTSIETIDFEEKQ